MNSWRSLLVSPTATVHDTIQVIDKGGMQLAIVTDDNLRLLGVVTDGDVRRAILKKIDLGSPVIKIMNERPKTADANDGRNAALAIMRTHELRHVPLVDQAGRIVGLEALSDLVGSTWRDNVVVIMAGGLGRRLQPLTNETPKPLLHVGGQPVLETIIRNFIAQGFRRFYLSVHYKAEKIIEYFGDGTKLGVEINYIQESRPLGTAGALSLLPTRPLEPILVMNGDILTNIDFSALLNFHLDHTANATMCVREHDFQIPYGAVTSEGHNFIALTEKPIHRLFVNAGIYVLSPDAVDKIEHDVPLDMTGLFERLRQASARTLIFPVREYWLDIGRTEDFDRAHVEFEQVFK